MDSLLDLEVKHGYYSQAEGQLLAQLKNEVASGAMARIVDRNSYGSGSGTELLKSLVQLYHKAGRHKDVLYLFEHAEGWLADDLSTLLDSDQDLGLYAAEALADSNRKEEAQSILEAALFLRSDYSGLDSYYRAYVDLMNERAIPFLQTLQARNMFEERPLIWMAHIARKQGNLEHAEELIDQAIRIDPSDGEQGKGDRMRAYAEKALIKTEQGDHETASFLKNVVHSIRLSEDADDIYNAGMLKRGIKMYREATTYFADAYCVQSRLAIQLEKLGDFESSAIHYQKAYELMPSSFGRVESHCFGCEGVFSSKSAQGIADRVFQSLVTKQPESPQVHYLYGYLQRQKGNHKEAAKAFQQAVILDPLYLSAWSSLSGVAGRAGLSSQEQEEIAFNIFQLNGQGRMQEAFNLSRVWTALQERQTKFPPYTPKKLLRLKASEKQLEQWEISLGKEALDELIEEVHDAYRSESTPGQTLANNNYLEHILRLYNTH